MLRLKARAKINWALDVCALREDGYHEVDLLLQSVDFGDEVELERKPAGISLACDLPGIPQDARNLAWRAAELMQRTFSRKDGVAITLYKAVPAQAGLGGGSGDAAAVMVGLRKLWDLEIEDEALEQLAAQLGADVPFMIRGGLARARGFGERLERLCTPEDWPILIVKPRQGLPTAEIFRAWDQTAYPYHPDMDGITRALVQGERGEVAHLMGNSLQKAAGALCPEVEAACEALQSAGALGSVMSGSGSAVLGLFADEAGLDAAHAALSGRYPICIRTRSARASIAWL
ncbi:4-diphosphocytidyl-2-C-methyl-D-erythritol kinase [uncultured Clostridium sp.]|nr:4-diphosphocytidyl-2-C-methyl-D-erythritol kinase [uncultured Clostridium sp.]